MMYSQWLSGRILRASTVLLMIMAGVVIVLAPGRASASTCVSWTGIQPPNPGAVSKFRSVAVLSRCNAWAVGSTAASADGPFQTLIEHWDGSAWKQVASPSPSSSANELFGVAAVSASNVWAVGNYISGTGIGTQIVVLHWNGTAWKRVASPNPGVFNQLSGVAAVSASNIWAVGSHSNGTGSQTLVLHWNGTAWKQVPSPSPGSDSFLDGVAAVSASNAWAVGGDPNGTLVLHWNGSTWKRVASPSAGSFNGLRSVAAVSASNAWAVGSDFNGTAWQTFVLHWNGTAWQRVASPNPGGLNGSFLLGVAAVSASDAWAVGTYSNGSAFLTLVVHWNGTGWKHVASPNLGGADDNELNGVAATSSTNIWAVGFSRFEAAKEDQLLAIHCC